MSNPLSLAEAVAEIEAKYQLQLKARAKTPASHKSAFHTGMVAGCEFALRLLARVTEPAELRAEVERLKAELDKVNEEGRAVLALHNELHWPIKKDPKGWLREVWADGGYVVWRYFDPVEEVLKLGYAEGEG